MAKEELNLFGPTVDQVRAAQEQADLSQMYQIAQLNPQQQRVFFGGMGGGMLGRGLADMGQAAGVPFIQEDPEVEKARTMQQVVDDVRKSGADVSDTVGFYRKVAGKLGAAGKTEAALQLSMKATMTEYELNKRKAEIGKLDAEALAKLREKESNIAKWQREFRVAIQDGRTEDAAEIQAAIQKEITPDSEESQEGAGTTTIEGKQVPMVRKVLLSKGPKPTVLWRGEPYATTGGTSVNVNAAEKPSAFDEAYLGAEGKKASEIMAIARAAPQKVAVLNALLAANDKALSGSFPEFQVGFLRALQTLGWSSKDMEKMLNSTDFFISNANAAVLDALGGSLGAQISDGDRKFVQAIIPQLQSSPEARKQLINWLKAKAEHTVVTGQALQEHVNNFTANNPKDKRSSPLTGFNPPPFKYDFGSAMKTVGPRTIGEADIKKYREVMGASVERYSDEQIKKMLQGLK